MKARLFWSIVLLIVIANAVYFVGLSIYSWRADQAYEAKLAAIKAESREAAALSEKAQRAANAEIDALEAPATDTDDDRQNMIEGEVVHIEDGNWVNDRGDIMRTAAD